MADALNPWKIRAVVRVQKESDKAHISDVTQNKAIPERNTLRYPKISPNAEKESNDTTIAN